MPRWFALVLGLLLFGAACGQGSGGTPDTGGTQGASVTLRLGYFTNLTHATALIGVKKGIFEGAAGPSVKFEYKTFNAGPQAVEALFADALDAAYVGPNPAINAFTQSNGQAIRIISGATSGGAFLVVKPGIDSAAELKGKKLATPQRGNTQDVALRAWLDSKDLRTDLSGGGDVSVFPQENAQTLETFRSGDIDGAWVPEPWASRMIVEAGGKVLVDERDLWPDGKYVTTHVIVRTEFREDHPEAVEALLRAQMEANDFLNSNSEEAKGVAGQALVELTGKGLARPVLDAAWKNLTFTNDPIASTLKRSASEAKKLDLLEKADIDGIYDLSILNKLLTAAGKPKVKA